MRDHSLERALCALYLALCVPLIAAATQQDIVGPPGSGSFGTSLTVLPNGNFVVADPDFDSPTLQNVGAVYLYSASGALISRLTGAQSNDRAGQAGVLLLANGNFVVKSGTALTWGSATVGVSGVISEQNSLLSADGLGIKALRNGHYVALSQGWNSGRGAVTWCNGATGQTVGEVSAANSLVGAQPSDGVGSAFPLQNPIVELSNGNFVVISTSWNNGATFNAGAVTWVNGTSGLVATVSPANSLVGTSIHDQVGGGGVTALPNGNYVVSSSEWNIPAPNEVSDVGAVTWGNGTTGTAGVISAANSLVGSAQFDRIGTDNGGNSKNMVTVLTNSNYVVTSMQWHSRSGAVTWGNGATGTVGAVSASNSLVGEPGSSVGSNFGGDMQGTLALSNGNYIVMSPAWQGVGAVTWGNGETGITGRLSSANSFVGRFIGDQLGTGGVLELANGNVIFSSPSWDASASIPDVGAVTWINGATGGAGPVSAANSLVGSRENDRVGYYRSSIIALANGNYVVASPFWNSTQGSVGAVTWGDGSVGTFGPVSESNSITGASADDLYPVAAIPLSNGNYVIAAPNWSNPDAGGVRTGAARWVSGQSSATGTMSEANSLVGNGAEQQGVIQPLKNGHYLVMHPGWDNPASGLLDVGAVTWGNGNTGTVGRVSASNSLIGTQNNQQLGDRFVPQLPLANGNYLLQSPTWLGVGALSWINGTGGTVGPVSAANSLVGSTVGDQAQIQIFEGQDSRYVVVSSRWDGDNIVDAGAVTFASNTGVQGVINASNSFIGSTSEAFAFPSDSYFDRPRERLFIAKPSRNVVHIFNAPESNLFKNGFE